MPTRINRADFLPPAEQPYAQEDRALPIGFGQTNSQPTVVAFMLKLLEPKPGDRILDLGCGSGWTTALLAECVGPKGQVIGLELVPQLVEFGRHNLNPYKFKNAEIRQAQAGVLGLPQEPVFDKILVSAAGNKLPRELLPQFTQRLVLPIKNSIWVFDKQPDGNLSEHEYPGFAFVPLL